MGFAITRRVTRKTRWSSTHPYDPYPNEALPQTDERVVRVAGRQLPRRS